MKIGARRAALAGVAVVAAVVLAVVLVGGTRTTRAHSVPTAFARIVRTDVVERQQVAGTLGYGGTFAVSNAGAAGVATWLPASGAIVRRGRPLYELDHRPVPLFFGDRPAYRAFTLGMTDAPDVLELKRNLVALGFGPLAADGRFDLATFAAVEAWQRRLALPVTGTIPLGGVVFLPGAVRVAATTATLGAVLQAGGAVLTATTPRPAVLLQLDPGTVAQVAVGDRVLVTMPDGATTNGRVTSVGRVAVAPTSDGNQGGPPTPTVSATVSLVDPHTRDGLDQAPVQVSITTQADRGVLAAPISALLAQPGGGYAVQVAGARTTRLVPVTTGLFDDVSGRVEISGAGLAPGVRVEVPAG